jgi:hypothetical protein
MTGALSYKSRLALGDSDVPQSRHALRAFSGSLDPVDDTGRNQLRTDFGGAFLRHVDVKRSRIIARAFEKQKRTTLNSRVYT